MEFQSEPIDISVLPPAYSTPLLSSYPTFLWDAPLHWKPDIPSNNLRYDGPEHNGLASYSGSNPSDHIRLKPWTAPLHFTDLGNDTCPAGWVQYTQPEGARYYWHPQNKIVTADDIADSTRLAQVNLVYDKFLALVRSSHRSLPAQWEIFLDLRVSKDNIDCHYYLIDHNARLPFWIHEHRPFDIGLPLAYTHGEYKNVATPEYWVHVEYYSMHIRLSLATEQELFGAVAQGCTDELTSPSSTATWSHEEATKIMSILSNVFSLCTEPEAAGYRTWIVARYWVFLARGRVINRYGLKFPRLDRHQGAKPIKQLTFLENVCRIALLGLTLRLYHRLHKVWANQIIYDRHWAVLLKDLRSEWTITTIWSTIVWSGNMSFLAFTHGKSISAIPSFISTACALGATATSFILQRSHSDDEIAAAPDATNYLRQAESNYGLHGLATVLTLPYALMCWSILTFAIAITTHVIMYSRNANAMAIMLAASSLVLMAVIISYRFFTGPAYIFKARGIVRWLNTAVCGVFRSHYEPVADCESGAASHNDEDEE